jgi:NAD-dependent deacetylase
MITDRLESLLATARRVAVLTGAGISAESGVPTFRDAQEGLWAKYDPLELATPEAFRRDPDLVWRWYSWRRETIAGVAPNPGHYALAEMESLFTSFTLVTQNVDNLHRRAGSRDVHELHGNIERAFCFECGKRHDGMAPPSDTVPRCGCGGAVRPDVVWFGEALPADELRIGAEAAAECDLFLSIGTSGQVYPAAQLPGIARSRGAYVVEINTGRTAISGQMDEVLIGPSGVLLPMLLDIASRHRRSA